MKTKNLKRKQKAQPSGSLEPVGSASVRALKRKMESALAAFHRIPGECDMDRVEPGRRIRRMVESRLRYQAALDSMPNH